jgi:hypothetical protein
MTYDMIDRFLRNNLGDDDYAKYSDALDEIASPPKRPWVGLTDEEASWCQAPSTIQTWKRIEAKLKEKNT